jgi:hypothetical protein
MIDVNVTTVVVGMMCTIVIAGFGYWLRGLLSANKDLDYMGCVHPTCQRRKTPHELLTEKQLKILKQLYPEHIKQREKEEEMRVEENHNQNIGG